LGNVYKIKFKRYFIYNYKEFGKNEESTSLVLFIILISLTGVLGLFCLFSIVGSFIFLIVLKLIQMKKRSYFKMNETFDESIDNNNL
jgi:hypothetical protein